MLTGLESKFRTSPGTDASENEATWACRYDTLHRIGGIVKTASTGCAGFIEFADQWGITRESDLFACRVFARRKVFPDYQDSAVNQFGVVGTT